MRASLVAISTTLLVASTLLVGCDRDGDAPADRTDDAQAADGDVDEDVVIAGGDIELTLDDVDDAVDRVRLLAPEGADGRLPDQEAEWMQNPRAQVSLLRNLEHFAIVRHSADEYGLEVDDADLREIVADHDQLRTFLPLLEDDRDDDQLRDHLEDVDLDVDDLRHLARDLAYADKLEQHLVDDFSDDRLWAIYQEAEDAADVVVATVHNSPTSAEIDQAVHRYDDEIRDYYEEHRDRYMTPPRVELTIVEGDDDTSVLRGAADRLDDGDDPGEIAADLDLDVRTEVPVSRHANPGAYHEDAQPGDTGVLDDDRFGTYAWQIEDRTEPRPRELDRPLRREIASQVMQREEEMTPSSRDRARQARQIMAELDADGPVDDDRIDELVDRLEDDGFDAVHTGFFSVRQSPRLPEIGLAENLFDAVGDLDFDDPVTEPVVDRDSVHVARLVDRKHPERERWEQERDEFRAQFMERNRDQLVDQHVSAYREEHELTYHTDRLAEHYGVDEPDKPEAGPSQAQPPGPDGP